MMRTIKFRAYVKPKGKVLPVYGLDFSNVSEWPVTIADCGDLECGLCIDYYENKDVEIMQFTGLVDKNGVEIYEGDIWKVDGLPQVVEMIDGCWQAIGRTAYGDIYDEQTFDLISFRHIEVIGNIYENAHLLKETEG